MAAFFPSTLISPVQPGVQSSKAAAANNNAVTVFSTAQLNYFFSCSTAGGANFLVNNLDTVESDTSLNIIQDISKEAMRLNGMVENLLNMTRIQEGNFKINKKLEVVDDIISTAVSAITNRKENHELVVKETKDIILFPCDAQLIVQVLVNLLDNAFKHTPDASKVMLKAFVRNNNIIFQVIDNGKGIEISSSIISLTISLQPV